MRRSLIASALVLFLFVSASAQADMLSFTFSSTTYSGAATLTGTPDAGFSGAFDITGVSGRINGLAISLAPVPAGADSSHFVTDHSGLFFIDNVVYPHGNGGNNGGNGIVDYYGLVFQDSANTLYNIYSNSDGSYVIYPSGVGGSGYGSPDTFTVGSGGSGTIGASVTPEPSSLLLLGTGLLTTVGTMRRRIKSA